METHAKFGSTASMASQHPICQAKHNVFVTGFGVKPQQSARLTGGRIDGSQRLPSYRREGIKLVGLRYTKKETFIKAAMINSHHSCFCSVILPIISFSFQASLAYTSCNMCLFLALAVEMVIRGLWLLPLLLGVNSPDEREHGWSRWRRYVFVIS